MSKIPQAPLAPSRLHTWQPPAVPPALPWGVIPHHPHASHNQSVTHLGQLGSLPPALRGLGHDIHQWFRLGALHTRWPTPWGHGPATEMMDLLSFGTMPGAAGRVHAARLTTCVCCVGRDVLRPAGASLHAPQPGPQQQMLRRLHVCGR